MTGVKHNAVKWVYRTCEDIQIISVGPVTKVILLRDLYIVVCSGGDSINICNPRIYHSGSATPALPCSLLWSTDSESKYNFRLGWWCLMPLSKYFSCMVEINYIGGGNRSTRRKPPTFCQSLTNRITQRYIEYTQVEWGGNSQQQC